MTSRPPLLLLPTLLLGILGCSRIGSVSAAVAQPPPAAQANTPVPAGHAQLARVRPPPARCTNIPRPGPQLLTSRAELALDAGDHDKALACADEALRLAPRLVAALRDRGAALTELGRLAEARLAYARALAIDPDDPVTLLGAADLYVSHLDGDRESLTLGLEYALHGARVAQRRHQVDKDLAASLFLVAATAENDLGDSPEALTHTEQVLRLRTEDPEALYERGVALYELCRFSEAAAALEAVVAKDPDDAWALYYLALVMERMGNGARADALERRARKLAPGELPSPVDVDHEAFVSEVRRAVSALPDVEQQALRDVPLEIADVPSLDDLTAVDPPLSPSILGLYRGPPERVPCLPEEGPRCRSIVFYRRNLVRFAKSRPELEEQVRVTLLHELGHLHGESDDDLRARGLE